MESENEALPPQALFRCKAKLPLVDLESVRLFPLIVDTVFTRNRQMEFYEP